MNITLIQPRHSYAPDWAEAERAHIYLPTSLLTVAAMCLQAGCKVTFQDENIRRRTLQDETIGINLVGAPYIPVGIEMRRELMNEVGSGLKLLIGGQVVNGLTQSQFTQLFGENSYFGNNVQMLAKVLEVSSRAIPEPREISLIPAYELISDEDMRDYLSGEFSLYLSQGCKYACDFCAAVRTFRETDGTLRRVAESYRGLAMVENDLDYLVSRAKSLGLEKLQVYLSNLDLFQSPIPLREFARIVTKVRASHGGFPLSFRGLATVDSFLRVADGDSRLINQLTEAGLTRIGFGVDGMSKAVWHAINKGQNTEDKCFRAISLASAVEITPETLMVFGHSADTEESLQLAVMFAKRMWEDFGSIPRPHAAKPTVPGNHGWIDPQNADVVQSLLRDPEAFQGLDFTALHSSLTCPDPERRQLANAAYLELCNLPSALTQYTLPIVPGMTAAEREEVRRFNLGKYDI